MTFLGLMTNFAALTLCVLVLATHNHQARALRHSTLVSKKNIETSSNGLCASSIAVHGYKCQEYEVRTLYITFCQKKTLYINMHGYELYNRTSNIYMQQINKHGL
jgi:hypothetical protein